MDFQKVKAYVCPVPGRAKEIAAIKKMILQAGGELVCDDEKALDGFEACVDQCDVVVILICPETETVEYEAVIGYASKTGKRVVGVWLEDETVGTVPGPLERDGDAMIIFSPDSVKRAVIEKEDIWELPSGKERPTQKTPRHKG